MKMRSSNYLMSGNIGKNGWQRHFNKLGVCVPIIKWMMVTPLSVQTLDAYYFINPLHVKTFTSTTSRYTRQHNRHFILQHAPIYYLRSVRHTTSTFTAKASSSHFVYNSENEKNDTRNKTNFDSKYNRKEKRRFTDNTTPDFKNNQTKNENNQLQQHVEATLFNGILPGIIQRECAMDHNTEENILNDITAVEWTILVGVSGGCDSTALLHLLHCIMTKEKENIRQSTVKSGRLRSKSNNKDSLRHIFNGIHVVHFDHQQRNMESDLDRILVQTLCEQELKVPFYCFKYNDRDELSNNERATEPKQFAQEDARNWRRTTMRILLHQIIANKQQSEESKGDNLEQTSNGRDQLRIKHIGLLITAHHQDDSDETLLLKILRGVHITNLQGLPSFVRDYYAYDAETSRESLDEWNDDDNDTMICAPMYWIRPLIHVTKDEIMSYMQSNKYSWREDSSNKSNKYVRNRVRNELIPLINDILSYKQQKDDDVIKIFDNFESTSISRNPNKLHKRLETLQKQSLEIRNDLDARVQEYLQQSNSLNGDIFYLQRPHKQQSFPIRNDADFYQKQNFDSVDDFFDNNKLLLKHALFRWIHQRKPTVQISYERIESVIDQIIQYPKRNQWTINIGHGYNIQRYGNSLQLKNELESINEEYTALIERSHLTEVNGNLNTFDKRRTRLEWSAIPRNPNGSIDNDLVKHELLRIVIQKPEPLTLETDIQFECVSMNDTRYRDRNNALQPLAKYPFTPYWRNGHNPIPLSEFLRGQKIPLDRRKDAHVILMSQAHATGAHTTPFHRIVAVYVEAKENWVLDAEFAPFDETPNADNSITIDIQLPKV